MGLFDKLFGTRSQREIKKIQPTVDKILALEAEYKNLSEEALQAKTGEFKDRLAKGETLDNILPEAFATVREAADRVLGAAAASGDVVVDYVALVDPATFAKVDDAYRGPAVLAVAARVGNTRLIDNVGMMLGRER